MNFKKFLNYSWPSSQIFNDSFDSFGIFLDDPKAFTKYYHLVLHGWETNPKIDSLSIKFDCRILCRLIFVNLWDDVIIWEHIWVNVFKNGPSKICPRQPLKNSKSYGLLRQTISLFFKGCVWQILLGSFLNTLTHICITKQLIHKLVLVGLRNFSFSVWDHPFSTYFTFRAVNTC